MKITIDVSEKDVIDFFEELNRDDGLRERAVNSLLQQTSPSWIASKMVVERVLRAFSKAFYDGLAEHKLFHKRQRERELYRLAFPN